MSAISHVAPAAAMGSALRHRLPERLRVALDLVGVSLIALFLAGFVERNVTHQGDLKTYQLAARAALDGLDPYRPESLSDLAGRRVFPFIYPPVALVPFLAIASLPTKVVAAGWMWAKIAILGVLILAWTRWLTGNATLLPVALVATFGWNSSAQWDLAAGNVAIVECALVWAAFGCFLAGWRTRFALLIVAAACFKLMPAAFLLLLLVPTERAMASPKRLVAGLAILAVVVLGPLLIGPAAQFQRFWAHLPDATGYGPANPSALGLATNLAQQVGWSGGVGTAIWAAYAAGLVACSVPLLREAYRLRDAGRWVMTAVFLYVLLLPRPMAYGFVILAPAPLFFSPKPFDSAPGRLLLALLLAAQGLWRLTSIASDSLLVTYAPFLLSLCVWLLVVNGHATASAPAGDWLGTMSKGVRMQAAARRGLLSAVLVVSTFGVARGQTVCDQLLPIGVVPPQGGFSLGCTFRYVLKRGAAAGSGPSNYIALDPPACANGPCAGLALQYKFMCEMTNGYSCCVSASDSISIVAGNYTGPTIQALNQRFASDTDTIPDICHSEYVGNGARVVHVPLIHPVGNGVTRTQVSGFHRMFLTRRVLGNGDITVEFVVGPTPVGSASWGRTKIRFR